MTVQLEYLKTIKNSNFIDFLLIYLFSESDRKNIWTHNFHAASYMYIPV